MTPKFSVLIFLLFVLVNSISTTTDSVCGDWATYKDEYCFKILDDNLRNFANAEKACTTWADHRATLAAINSADEQSFIVDYVFTQLGKVNSFWIGAKYNAAQKRTTWTDGSPLGFTNWDTGAPRNKSDYCAKVRVDVDARGRWLDEPCDQVNLVLCQKAQIWTMPLMQRVVMDLRRELRSDVARIDATIKDIKKQTGIDELLMVEEEVDKLKNRVQGL